MLIVAGLVPLVVSAWSHAPPDVVDMTTWKGSPKLELFTDNATCGLTAPPLTADKEMEAGVAVRVGALPPLN